MRLLNAGFFAHHVKGISNIQELISDELGVSGQEVNSTIAISVAQDLDSFRHLMDGYREKDGSDSYIEAGVLLTDGVPPMLSYRAYVSGKPVGFALCEIEKTDQGFKLKNRNWHVMMSGTTTVKLENDNWKKFQIPNESMLEKTT